MNVFDFVNSINSNKKDLFEEPGAEKEYIPFTINRSLSYFPDTIFYSNEININHHIPKRMQFDFLRYSVPKRNRFSKWAKKDKSTKDISIVMEYYGYSAKRATEIIDILTDEQLHQMKQSISKGGYK